jgi:hypothetical protein
MKIILIQIKKNNNIFKNKRKKKVIAVEKVNTHKSFI